MASYLGKISALVTANTAPFRSALQGSAKDLNRWRSQVNRTLNEAGSGDWDRQILTKMQQVRQAVAAAQTAQLNFPNFDARRIEQMYSALRQIRDPLSKIRDDFEGLSVAVQTKFVGALEAVQNEALRMRDAIESGARIGQAEFAALERQVSRTANAISRLREMQAATSRLSTGEELRFKAPTVAAQLARAVRIQPKAEEILGTSNQSTNRLFALQGSLAKRLAGLRAQIEAEQMRATPDATLMAALVSSEERYAAALKRTNDVLESRIANVERMNELPLEQRKLEEHSNAVMVSQMRRARERDAALEASDDAIRREALLIRNEGASSQLPSNFAVMAQLRARGQRARESSAQFRNMQFYDVAFESRLRAESSSVSTLGRELARLGVQAGGPTAQAFDRLTAEAEEFARGGVIASRQARQELERLRNVAIDTAVRVGDITATQATSLRARTGDISRGGTDKISLGIQQAAFAVEDFFSVTGGLDQRIRAAGNNISQLGFILGGTAGLFAGIGTVIAAQLISPLLRTTKIGRDFEDWLDSAKLGSDAFRTSLEAQRRAVESLANAYQNLSSSILESSLSPAGKQQEANRQVTREIQKALRSAREQQLFSADSTVIQADTRVLIAERRLSNAPNPAEARQAAFELEAARAEQSRARAAAVRRATRPVDVAAVRAQAERDVQAARERAEQLRRATGATGGSAASMQAVGQLIVQNAERQAQERIAAAENAAAFQARQRGIDQTGTRLGGLLVGGNVPAAIAQDLAGRLGPGEITRRLDDVARIRKEIAEVIAKAIEDGVDPSVYQEVIVKANRLQIALLGAASAMQGFVGVADRISQSAGADVGSLEQRAERDRREAVMGIPGAAGRAIASSAAAADARRLRQRLDDSLDIARRRVEEGVLAQDFTRLGQIETTLQSQQISVDERARLLAERRAIRNRVDAAIENDPDVQAARGLRDQATRDAEFAAALDRGRVLAMTPGQRVAEDLRGRMFDINAFFGDQAEQGSGLVDIAARNQAMARVFREAVDQTAPMLAQFRDEVLTARLQGPSRAALNMVDVGTMEGQRELNRLLRGDDSARDINLAELQKQTVALQELVRIAEGLGITVAD